MTTSPPSTTHKGFGAAAALRAALMVTGSTYIAYAAGLVASLLVARALGPADYGRYAYLVWLGGLVVMFMNNGLTTTSIRYVSETLGRNDPAGVDSLHRWFWIRQWISIVVVAAALALALPLLHPAGWEGRLSTVWMIVACASVPKAWYLFGISMAKGHGRFGIEAKTMSVLSLVNAACVVALMLVDASLETYLALFVLSSVVHPLLLSRMAQRVRSPVAPAPLDPALAARVNNHYLWTALLTLMAVLYGPSMMVPFLNEHVGADAVGYFSVAMSLTRGGIELLSSGLNSVLMPLMSHGFGSGGQERTQRISANAVRVFHAFGLLLAGVGVFWAAPLVLTLYGARYAEAVLSFQVLVVLGGLTLPAGVLATLLSTTDRQRVRTAVTGGSVLLFGAAAWWLIPVHGLNGALMAYAGSAVVIQVAWMLVAVRVGGMTMPTVPMLRLCAAAVLAAGLVGLPLIWVDGLLAPFVAGIAFVGLYIAATFWLRAWSAEDLDFLAEQTRRFGPVGRLTAGLRRYAA
ncbi:lipopolysaccharide biosynthesis protein [Leptothrix discophora]|uniref:Oligosaccharide flippase family protein n=1 Tax=Leptothrix discophora TaxID=89 RepID=A0ABT9G0H1_LEPDI|nr:oligosaccharide flippase family protein [Leptothrix discophora]MDP4299906.1 oligosaccharide flippase family protein [Leptothrix discophora]